MSQSLRTLLNEHQGIHFLKRLAYFSNNKIPDSFFRDCRHVYVLKMSSLMSIIDESVKHSNVLIEEIIHEPPKEWIVACGLTQEEFFKLNFNIFTTILYSIFDQILLLINETFPTPMESRKVNYKSIKEKIRNNVELLSILSSFYDATNSIAESRHSYLHQGISRNAGRLDGIQRVKTIMGVFGIEKEGVKFYSTEAIIELVGQMKAETKLINDYLEKLDQLLVNNYLTKLENLGGIDRPTHDENLRAKTALDYMCGKTNETRFINEL